MPKSPDPRAIAVAQAVQNAAPEDAVIVLFGSRARGDYRPGSDIDLMLLLPEPDRYCSDTRAAASHIAHTAVAKEYGHEIGVDILPLDYAVFRRGRRAVNHVAAHITRDGIPMTQLPFDALDSINDDDGYPDNWPDTSERLRDALDSFRSMRHDLADGAEKYMGRHGQETLEHCYKALISALGVTYPRTHDLRALEALLDRLSERHAIHIPPSHQWLNSFAGADRYSPPPPLPIPPQELFDSVELAKNAIVARVHEIAGTTATDL